MATVEAVNATDDPELELRRRLQARLPGAPMPQAVQDPVYGAPEATPPPPVALPGPAVPTAPLTVRQPGLTNTQLNTPTFYPARAGTSPINAIRAGDEGPTSPGLPTGPVTSDNDPRLRDPVHGNDPEVLAWLNRSGGPGDPGGIGDPTPGNDPNGPKNGDYRSWVHGLLANVPFSQAGLLSIEQTLNKYGIKIEPANSLGERTKIRLPNGQVVRLGFGEGSWQWIVQPPAGGGGGGGAPAMPGGQSQFQDELRKILMQRLGLAGQPVDQNDPYIREPMVAAETEAARQTQAERTALAERLAATGDTSRSLEMGIQQSGERNAVGLGSLRAKLIADEYNKRRQEMDDLLQMAIASSDAQAARDIQAAIVALDQARWDATFNAGLGD
jgi:hypothetical protein